MTPKPYRGFGCFEHYWQAGKEFEGVDFDKSVAWWKKQTRPRRRYPNSRGKRVLHARFPDHPPLDYVASRKRVYVPEYHAMMTATESFAVFRQLVRTEGPPLVISDFDGPRTPDGSPVCLEATQALLREKINDVAFPFGHGYVVAAAVQGIEPEAYV